MKCTPFCRDICGQCKQCRTAMKELGEFDAILADLAKRGDYLHTRPDPDDPRTYALDASGRP